MEWTDYARIALDLLWQSARSGDVSDMLILFVGAAALALGALELVCLLFAALLSLFLGPRNRF